MWPVELRWIIIVLMGLVGLSGCATVDPAPDLARVESLVERSTGRTMQAQLDEALPDRAAIDAALERGLTSDDAVDLALRNNRELQAALLEVAIARANLVQAGLLTNPSFGLESMFPSSGRAMFEATLLMTLSELWQIEPRKAAAAADLEQAILETAHEAGELVAAVRTAFAEAVAAREEDGLAGERLVITRRTLEVTEALEQAGLASPREATIAQQAVINARADLEEAVRRHIARLAQLGTAMSIDHDLTRVALNGGADGTATIAPDIKDMDALIASARHSRLDLLALAQAETAAMERVGFEESKAFGDVRLGPMFMREGGEETGERAGFMLQWMIPIFDQNQAQVARAGYEAMRRRMLAEARFMAIAQDIRSAAEDARAALARTDLFLDELVPAAMRGVNQARDAYQAGEATMLDVLAAEQRLVDARRDAVRAQADHHAAMARLELAVGAPLTSWSLASRTH